MRLVGWARVPRGVGTPPATEQGGSTIAYIKLMYRFRMHGERRFDLVALDVAQPVNP